MRVVLPITLLIILCAVSAEAQSGDQIAVVINEASADSIEVGEYYAHHRQIPASNIIRIRTTAEETVERAAYSKQIEQPIATAIMNGRLQDRILYIVLTKGVPLQIKGTQGHEGTTASVDSELTLLYRRLVGHIVLTRGRIDNPYFLGTRPFSEARPFTHRDFDIFLVSRLDAFTAREAIDLVTRCQAPSATGQIVLDQRGLVSNRLADAWLDAAAGRLQSDGHAGRVVVGPAPKLASDAGVLGYYSWGSTDPDNRSRTLNLKFVPGALAASFVSTDARTFREPPSGWAPVERPEKSTWFGGSSQSLVGDLIRQGVSGVAGHVSEPYLQSVVRPETLFQAYLAGFSLVESFYLALPHVSWQAVIIGDPLCRVVPRAPLTRADLDPGLDTETDQPLWFAERQTKRLAGEATGVLGRALTLWARAENFIAQGNTLAAREALEEATRAAPQMLAAHMKLAEVYNGRGEYDLVIERYRIALKLKPNDLVAMNNLAYALSVHKGEHEEALALARRAVVVGRSDGSVLDTLAWVEHQMGDTATAVKRIADAVRRKPENPDIRLHAAIIYGAVDALDQAKIELDEALRLNDEFAEREDVRKLQAKIAARPRGPRPAPAVR